MKTQRLIPTGDCFCGCGGEASRGAFFIKGHDRVAKSRVIKEVYGDVIGLMKAHGYLPSKVQATQSLCKDHPTYQAKKKPRVSCADCWAAYIRRKR